VTGEQVITAIRECAQKLGRTPSREEFVSTSNVSARTVRNRFGSYTRALNAAGLELPHSNPKIDMQELFVDWAALARAQGRVPSLPYYQQNSKFSVRPLLYRFGNWTQVPFGMQVFAERQGLEGQFQDVLEMVQAHRRVTEQVAARTGMKNKLRVWKDRPVFGPPVVRAPLGHAPVNEQGVIFLFGSVAEQLGFMVTHVQAEFPDALAFVEVEPGRWQLVRIEFEYESRNFMRHGHDPQGCDVIVCWIHNWPDCPLDVVELRSVVGTKYGVRAGQ
jgi:Homing endonuclease associated repeat